MNERIKLVLYGILVSSSGDTSVVVRLPNIGGRETPVGCLNLMCLSSGSGISGCIGNGCDPRAVGAGAFGGLTATSISASRTILRRNKRRGTERRFVAYERNLYWRSYE